MRNKLKRYKENGAAGPVHKSRGRTSPARWNQKEREFVMDLFYPKKPRPVGVVNINRFYQ